MLANKKSTQTLVFIAFVAFISIPIAKSGFKKRPRNYIRSLLIMYTKGIVY